VSRIRCLGVFWTINPLRKVLCHEKPHPRCPGGAVAAVAVSTLHGHMLQGREDSQGGRGGGSQRRGAVEAVGWVDYA
jgi:hypothetical protein